MSKELFDYCFGNEKNELEELNKWIDNNILDKNGNYKVPYTRENGKLLKKKYLDKFNQIVEITNFLNEHYDGINIKQRLWHIRNEDLTLQRCNLEECNNVVKWGRTKYQIFCCQSCNSIYSNTGENNPQWKGGIKNKRLVSYEAGVNLINKYERWIDYRRKPDNKYILQVSCDWCGEWFDVKYNNFYNFLKRKPKYFYLHCSTECDTENPLHSKNGQKGLVSYFKGGWEYVSYDTYSPQIDWCDETDKEGNTEALLVKCYHCRKWFRPTKMQVLTRLNGINDGTCNFYCSEQCKNLCPNYRTRKYYKHNRPYETPHINEVHPELRRIVFERDNYECQICGEKEHIVCHHIDPIANNPIESADVDNCITLCKECHENVHKLPGCSKGYLSSHCNLI